MHAKDGKPGDEGERMHIGWRSRFRGNHGLRWLDVGRGRETAIRGRMGSNTTTCSFREVEQERRDGEMKKNIKFNQNICMSEKRCPTNLFHHAFRLELVAVGEGAHEGALTMLVDAERGYFAFRSGQTCSRYWTRAVRRNLIKFWRGGVVLMMRRGYEQVAPRARAAHVASTGHPTTVCI